MDECGVQINNKPGKVVATKGSKEVHVLTSAEKGENVTVVACSNAEGNFFPPVLIMKGARKNPDHLIGLPAGADIYMNKQSSYINSDLFLRWFKEHFLARKGVGKSLLILDGHVSHCTLELLKLADENDVIMICLPSHTTQALQPLDRSFFKAFKEYFKQAAQTFMFQNKERKISRFNVGQLIGEAWKKAATIGNGTSGFEASGIYPFRPEAVPDYFFKISDVADQYCSSSKVQPLTEVNQNISQEIDQNGNVDQQAVNVFDLPEGFFDNLDNYITMPEETTVVGPITLVENIELSPGATVTSTRHLTESIAPSTSAIVVPEENMPTPSKFLHEISPVPIIPQKGAHKRKQGAEVLTSAESIDRRTKIKLAREDTQSITVKTHTKAMGKRSAKSSKAKAPLRRPNKLCKTMTQDDTSSASSSSIFSEKSTSKQKEDDVDCIECLENYLHTKDTADWIQCIDCNSWLHETCTMYENRCNSCGRAQKRKDVAKRKLLN